MAGQSPDAHVAKQALPFGLAPSVLGGGYNRTGAPCPMRTEGGEGGYGRTDAATWACAFNPWRGATAGGIGAIACL